MILTLMKNIYAIMWRMDIKWTWHYIASLVHGEHWSLEVRVKAYIITNLIIYSNIYLKAKPHWQSYYPFISNTFSLKKKKKTMFLLINILPYNYIPPHPPWGDNSSHLTLFFLIFPLLYTHYNSSIPSSSFLF